MTNDLPVFKGDLLHNGYRDSNNATAKLSAFELAENVRLPMGRQATVDVNDYFYDPDGDAIQVRSLRAYTSTAGTTEQIPGYKLVAPTERLAYVEQGSAQVRQRYMYTKIVNGTQVDFQNDFQVGDEEFYIDGNNNGFFDDPVQDFVYRYDTAYSGGFKQYGVFLTDGQRDASGPFANMNNEVQFPLGVTVQTNLGSTGSLNTIGIQSDNFGYKHALGESTKSMSPLDTTSTLPDQWQFSVMDTSRRIESYTTTSVGDVAIDPLTGAPQIFHPLVLDGSGGASETPISGLLFDGESAYSNPFIKSRSRTRTPLQLPVRLRPRSNGMTTSKEHPIPRRSMLICQCRG